VSKRFPYPDGFTLSDLNDILTKNVDFKINRTWGIFGAGVNQFRGHPEDGAPPLRMVDLEGLTEEAVDAAEPITVEEVQGHLAATPEGAEPIGVLELFTYARLLATLKKQWPAIYAVARKAIDAVIEAIKTGG
jgi:hypothetical protein